MDYAQFMQKSIVPDGVVGRYRLDTFEVDAQAAELSLVRSIINGVPHHAIPPGTYQRLLRDDTVVMSNTPMEQRTNLDFVYRAAGEVLINGLGMGMVLHAILQNPEVTRVTVIEVAAEVIELVAPSFITDRRVHILHADAFQYTPPRGIRYDAVWHDIWDTISSDNLPQMKRLHAKYQRRTAWQESWCHTDCRRMARFEQGLRTRSEYAARIRRARA